MAKDERVIKVSICLITYNHEGYISQALESILMQVVDFNYEIIVGDDYSIDNTREIIRQYQHLRPGKIELLERRENLGLKKNYIEILDNCKGQYIAVLSGDDYWIDPFKLQKQVHFLDNNPEYVMVGHNAIVVDEINGGSPSLINTRMRSYDLTTKELMVKNPFAASQVMYRNNLVIEFPEIFFLPSGEDRRIYLLLSQYGKCRFEYDVTGVYRIHDGSITNKCKSTYKIQRDSLKNRIELVKEWNIYFKNQYCEEERNAIAGFAKRIVNLAVKNLDFRTVREYLPLVKIENRDTRKRQVLYKILKLFIHKESR